MNVDQFSSCDSKCGFPTTIKRLFARVIITLNLWKYTHLNFYRLRNKEDENSEPADSSEIFPMFFDHYEQLILSSLFSLDLGTFQPIRFWYLHSVFCHNVAVLFCTEAYTVKQSQYRIELIGICLASGVPLQIPLPHLPLPYWMSCILEIMLSNNFQMMCIFLAMKQTLCHHQASCNIHARI